MSAPLVSILVPVFNGEPFLAECLESILAQDLGNYEVLISDDGSTDGSAAVIQRYVQRDSCIRWWRNPRNLGIGGNFNASLKAARGEYLKFVLQDDKLLDPSALRRMVAAMESDASVSLVGSASHLIDAQSRLLQVCNRFRRSGVQDGKRVIIYCLERNGNSIGGPPPGLPPTNRLRHPKTTARAPHRGALAVLQCFSSVSNHLSPAVISSTSSGSFMWKNLWIALANPVRKSKFFLLPITDFFW